MKKAILSICITFLASQAVAEDALWESAVDYYEATRHWLPEEMVINTAELNGEGEEVKTQQTVLSLFLNSENELDTELVLFTLDGEDQTEEQRRRAEEREENNDEEGQRSFEFEDSPLARSAQENLEYERINDTEYIRGSLCQGFEFYMVREGEDQNYEGTVWIDRATGQPVQMVYTLDPMPPFVSEFQLEVNFRQMRSEDRILIDTLNINGQAGVLFVQKRFTSTVSFGEYSYSDFPVY
ncbi:MAG: hypothetical protein ACLFR1_00230 [Spirochaetia bacterium]